MNLKVSIVIINYNTKGITFNCIESIFSKTKDILFELIVIDNASRDGSKEKLSKLKYDNYQYIYNNENLGFSKTNNQGSRIARGDYLFFLNSDTILLNNVISVLVDCLEENQSVGIVGPKFLNSDRTLQISCRSFPSIKFGLIKIFPFIKYFLKKEVTKYYQDNKDHNKNSYVDTVSAGAFMISSKLFNEIGGFDEFSFMYAEDADICKRVRELGYKVMYNADAIIIHYGGQSSKLNSYKAIWSYYMAFYNLYKKHYFKKKALFIKPVFVFAALVKVLLYFFKKDKRMAWKNK